jgi:hypothetical protein
VRNGEVYMSIPRILLCAPHNMCASHVRFSDLAVSATFRLCFWWIERHMRVGLGFSNHFRYRSKLLKRREKGGRRTCNGMLAVFGANTPIKVFFSFLENEKLEEECREEKNKRCGGVYISTLFAATAQQHNMPAIPLLLRIPQHRRFSAYVLVHWET